MYQSLVSKNEHFRLIKSICGINFFSQIDFGVCFSFQKLHFAENYQKIALIILVHIFSNFTVAYTRVLLMHQKWEFNCCLYAGVACTRELLIRECCLCTEQQFFHQIQELKSEHSKMNISTWCQFFPPK